MKPGPAKWPYTDHRTMAQVMADEQQGCTCENVRSKGHRIACPVWRVEAGLGK